MKALVVDDHAIFRKMVQQMLPASYEVLQAENGVKALEHVKNNPDISIILTDHNMPKLKGLDFIKSLHQEGLLDNITVVFLTSERDKQLINEATSLGIKHWLPKPFKKEDLLKVLETAA